MATSFNEELLFNIWETTRKVWVTQREYDMKNDQICRPSQTFDILCTLDPGALDVVCELAVVSDQKHGENQKCMDINWNECPHKFAESTRNTWHLTKKTKTFWFKLLFCSRCVTLAHLCDLWQLEPSLPVRTSQLSFSSFGSDSSLHILSSRVIARPAETGEVIWR